MKGDFTRDTFNPINHYSRVLMQQGRVALDADVNEQTAILLHYIRMLAVDLIGPHAAPKTGGGFKLTWDQSQGLLIGSGRMYVDGVLVENEVEASYAAQTDFPLPADDKFSAELKERKGDTPYWLYLDVWERHITSIEDDSIREKALGGPDTCTRTKVVWQVKAIPWKKSDDEAALKEKLQELETEKASLKLRLANSIDLEEKKKLELKIGLLDLQIAELKAGAEAPESKCRRPMSKLVNLSQSSLTARVEDLSQDEGPCVTPPDSKYRGVENQLYRVEIHRGGNASQATFKWARDNGSLASAWLGTFGNDLQVANARGFSANQWVELTDDVKELQGVPGLLVKLAKVEGDRLSVDPGLALPTGLGWSTQLVNPKVRRWDQKQTGEITLSADGVIPVKEGANNWIDLEDGVQVQFSTGGAYRSGDYWLIPARVAGGQIEWPVDASIPPKPLSLPPHGIHHHYAPLGFVLWSDGQFSVKSCRCEFEPQTDCSVAETAAHEERPESSPTGKNRTIRPVRPRKGR